MDGLRWLLLIAGVLVVAGVYWYSRRESARPGTADTGARREPSLRDVANDPAPAADDFSPVDPPAAGADRASDPDDDAGNDAVSEKIVTLRLIAGKGGSFAGDEMALGLRRVGMRHGRFGIFHRCVDEDENKIVFSAASLVEPGSFDLANLKDQKLPGISLFLVLPGPLDGAEAFDLMMAAARSLAKSMQGELLDESGSTLSIQRERYMREEIIQHRHGIKVA